MSLRIACLVASATLIGLIALGVVILLPCASRGAQSKSPLPTPTSPPTPNAEPTRWPTLTPPPTHPMPTAPLTPFVIPTLPPTPIPTPLPTLPFPEVPVGERPPDPWMLLYLPREEGLNLMGVVVDKEGRRWSDPKVVYDFSPLASGPRRGLAGLRVAPTGDRLSVGITYLESHELWLLDLVSLTPSQVADECEGYLMCSVWDWSPDGTRTVLNRYPLDVLPKDLVIYDVVAGQITKMAVLDTTFERRFVSGVSFSPDGQFLLWELRNRDGAGTCELWLTDHKGGQPQMLVQQDGQVGSVTWHPDGSSIVYNVIGPDQRARIWLMSFDDRETVSLLASNDNDSFGYPVWSPDGTRIALSRCEEAPAEASIAELTCEVSVFDYATGAINPVVTSSGRIHRELKWSPDGALLAYVTIPEQALESIWLYSPTLDKSYPVAGYIRPFSNYGWILNSTLTQLQEAGP